MLSQFHFKWVNKVRCSKYHFFSSFNYKQWAAPSLSTPFAYTIFFLYFSNNKWNSFDSKSRPIYDFHARKQIQTSIHVCMDGWIMLFAKPTTIHTHIENLFCFDFWLKLKINLYSVSVSVSFYDNILRVWLYCHCLFV